MNNIFYTGLDKTTITDFTIISIDFEKLKSQADKVTIYYTSSQNVTTSALDEKTNERVYFSYIGIQDNYLFSDLKIGAAQIRGTWINYESLSMFNRQTGQNNLIPLTMAAYKKSLKDTTDYIYSVYGIKIDTTNAKFQQLEYNLTVNTNQSFAFYERFLTLLCKLAPARLKDATSYSKEKAYTGNTLKNKTILYKFYDKSTQLNKKYNLELQKHWLRIELSITNENKDAKQTMEKYLGSAKIAEITDAALKKMFVTMFKRDFLTPFEKYLVQAQKDTYKILKSAKAQYKKNYLVYGINELMKQEIDRQIPPCFSYSMFIKQVDKLEKGNSNKAKLIKTAEKHIPEAWKDEELRADVIIQAINDMEKKKPLTLTQILEMRKINN